MKCVDLAVALSVYGGWWGLYLGRLLGWLMEPPLYQLLHIHLQDVALISATTPQATLVPQLRESTLKNVFIS